MKKLTLAALSLCGLIVFISCARGPGAVSAFEPTAAQQAAPAPATAETTAAPVQTAQTQAAATAETISSAQTGQTGQTGQTTAATPPDAKIQAVCSLYVKCDIILSNMDQLDPEKIELVPPDGVIYSSDGVEYSDGDSVYDVLYREMRNAKIHFEYVNTPALNSVYIKGINNIYEFDCGGLSGWTYRVNGEVPDYGCSQYFISPGDIVEILYTCDLGADIGFQVE